MGRVFITGDKHGNFQSQDDYKKVKEFCEKQNTTLDDVLIVLGDHGILYDGGQHDAECRMHLGKLPLTFVMIRGNHDMRTGTSWTREYTDKDTMSGWFINDPWLPNIFYTDEFAWYRFAGKNTFVVCGAYSADKYYRLAKQRAGYTGYRWFYDEQLNDVERLQAEDMLIEYVSKPENEPYIVMSHTCPDRYIPVDMFLPGIDQSSVDDTMEKWMESLLVSIEEINKKPEKWYCGHWHTDRTTDIMRFMYHDIIMLEDKTVEEKADGEEEGH